MSKKAQAEIKSVIDFMMQGQSLDGTLLLDQITLTDRRRKQNLADVEPEFAEIINYRSPE